MARGSACGDERGGAPLSIGTFVRDDGGYTTVAVAVALLVSLSLVFSMATAGWIHARSAEVQEVADASALAGCNAVAAFSTVAQVLDACVLSLGLAGVLVYGAGMVMAAIPFARAASPEVIEVGSKILRARRSFAHSASQGLARLEQALPALIMANSASCVSANCQGGMAYVGCAVPFPMTSKTDFSGLDQEVDEEEMDQATQQMQEATSRKEEAEKEAQDAKERAWRADCIDDPMCMRSRAETLAGLGGGLNPYYPSPKEWCFGYALIRARNYYLMRLNTEGPASDHIEELTRSAARSAFYEYAYDVLASATCEEGGDVVVIDLPYLPHTRAMVRETWLYTDPAWPCSQEEEGGRTLHSCVACEGFTGEPSGSASLADLEAGAVEQCPVCNMSVEVMSNVADASTNISNGFEHYWRIVVEESERYEKAKNEATEAEKEQREAGEKSKDAFERALDALRVERPRLCPAGAWGCIALVARRQGVSSPSQLASAFAPGTELPGGVALSAATLAPDNATEGNTVLSRMLDGFGGLSGPAGIVGNIAALWGRMLVAYGSSYESVSDVANDLFDGIGSLFGERVASWLKGKLSSIVEAAGFKPADMRLRKPVLVYSQKVLDKAGYSSVGKARELIEALPGSQEELADANWSRVVTALGVGQITIAEVPIPGTEMTIPLTIDVAKLLEAA